MAFPLEKGEANRVDGRESASQRPKGQGAANRHVVQLANPAREGATRK